MANFDPGLMDEYDDFEQQYADELELMNEMEEDIDIPPPSAPSLSKKTLHFTTPKHTNTKPCMEDSPLPVMTSLESPDLGSAVNGVISPPEVKNDTATLKANDVRRHNNLGDTPTGIKHFEDRKSRKRDKDEGYDPLSDSDGELVIDAPLPSPRRKKPRIREKRERTPEPQPQDNDFEITPPPSPDADEILMRKIQHYRAPKIDEFNVIGQGSVNVDLVDKKLSKHQSCLLTREPNCPFMTVTGYDGQRRYIRMKEDIDTIRKTKKCQYKDVLGGQSSFQLLSTPIYDLKEQVEDEVRSDYKFYHRRKQVLVESERISATLTRQLDAVFEDTEENDKNEKESEKTKSSLWVEKYTPRNYTDLLSDDGTNRTLLHWLKLWDYVVFGKELKITTKNQQDPKKQNKFNKKWQQQEEVIEDLDIHKRPVHKVALLCGPPGLGKTTLAHIIAKHAGYNVVEMNASDDRSPDIFRTRIEAATQMQSVLSEDHKPNCLIIDEIDGAPAPAINVLLSLLKKRDTGSDRPSIPGAPSKKKKKDQFMLLRPIICICNDQYVPSLRQLRQQAVVLHFPPTMSTRLASRLYEIARNNRLQTDQTTMLALCQKAENDIRSCINTLQFVSGRYKQLTLQLIHSLSIGQKDQHKGLFTVWQELFQLPKPKRKRYHNPHETGENGNNPGVEVDETRENTLLARFNKILQSVTSNGEYGKLTQGIFDNFLTVKFKDPYFEAVVLAHDWLAFTDILNQEILHRQNYILMRYIPYMPVVFHMLFASTSYPKIQYPNVQYENTLKMNKTTNLLTSLLSGVSAKTKRNVNIQTAVQELLPFLVEIVQPNLRPVNTQLFSGKEKDQLCNLIQTMIAYNLTYRQERSPEGQYNYILEPNVEEVIKFSGTATKKQMTYATKQLVAREIELEKLRRSEATFAEKNEKKSNGKVEPTKKVQDGGKSKPTPSVPPHNDGKSKPTPAVPPHNDGKSKPTPAVPPHNDGKSKPTPAVPRHKQQLEAKKIQQVEEIKPSRDFFGRIIKRTPPSKQNDSQQTEGDSQQAISDLGNNGLWYKFNEGFTNAIRRQVHIQDLL
ncbi:chromosome transmission fidelity protein 18 homolog [Glandiceps talaboti]